MPTGYTSAVIDGSVTSFKGFAILCMRAFGATIHMRDESLDVPYEPREVSTYHLDAVKRAKADLVKLPKITDAQLIAQATRSIKSSIAYNKRGIAKAKKTGVKLNKMLTAINKWTPPTSEHDEFKKFMVNQIEMTLKQDADTEYYTNSLKRYEKQLKRGVNVRKLRAERKSTIKRDIKYHTDEYAKEVERVNGSNTWVTDLIKSIN